MEEVDKRTDAALFALKWSPTHTNHKLCSRAQRRTQTRRTDAARRTDKHFNSRVLTGLQRRRLNTHKRVP